MPRRLALVAVCIVATAARVRAQSLVCPADVVASFATPQSQCGLAVSYPAPSASGVLTVVCVPASGSVFPVGLTTVTCSGIGDSPPFPPVNCRFSVTVDDAAAPMVVCPANITAFTDPGRCSAAVKYPAAIVSDECPVTAYLAGGPESGSPFPVGTTEVVQAATDASGNAGMCSALVTVKDTEPPVVACDDVVVAVPGRVEYAARGTDNCGTLALTFDPPAGSQFEQGKFMVDGTATDGAGNVASCRFTVTVECDAVATPTSVTCRLGALEGTVTSSVTTSARPRLVRLLEQALSAVGKADASIAAGHARAGRVRFRKARARLERFTRAVSAPKRPLPAEIRTTLTLAAAPIVTDLLTLAGS